MKRTLYASFFAAFAALSLSSCMNGDYDADPATVSTGSNPLNQGGNGGGNGGGNNSNFNWNGTDPMSAKVDGGAWLGENAMYIPEIQGYPASVTANGTDDNSVIIVNIPTNPTLNTTYTFGSNLTGSYSVDAATSNPNDIYGAGLGGSGQVQIIENDAQHIKGKFYFTGKNPSGGSRTIAEGYFNVLK